MFRILVAIGLLISFGLAADYHISQQSVLKAVSSLQTQINPKASSLLDGVEVADGPGPGYCC